MAENIRKNLSDDELLYVAGGATGRSKRSNVEGYSEGDQNERTETRTCKMCGKTTTHIVHMGGMVTCKSCGNSYSTVI
ncbi:MAG: hypothetical protein IJU77_09060 [Butyrivibrio sp.]|nr:hypothetical protein [Butyrivibrio sp.]